MANTATLLQTIPFHDQQGDFTALYQYRIDIDTANTPLTVHTPESGKRVGIFGAFWTAFPTVTLEFLSDSTLLYSAEMPASSGYEKPITTYPMPMVTLPSEPLKIRCNEVSLTFLLTVGEFSQLKGS